MKIEHDTIIFSSGKTRSANNGIVGLDADMCVFGGYDESVYCGVETESWRDEADRLTDAELDELADFMIERWTKFRYRERMQSK